MAAKVVRVGIIGQGRSGRDIHAVYLATVPDRFRILAVADNLKDRCLRAQRDFGCESTQDYRDLLKRRDLDLVVNASFSHLHVPITREALKAGHNVLCEKPLARRAAEVDELIALSGKVGKLLAVFQQSRFAPYFRKVREIIDSGVLGRIVMIKIASNSFSRRWDWQTLREMNGGNLLNTGPHPLDQALMLFDPDLSMPEVWCRMDRAVTFGNAEDHVKLLLTSKDMPTIDLEISSCCAYPLYTYQVYGTRGGLTGNSSHIQWKCFDPARAPRRKLTRIPLPGPSYCSEKLPWVERTWDQPAEIAGLFRYLSQKFYDNLHRALTRGTPLDVTPEQVRRQIAVIEECHRQNAPQRHRGHRET
jgi:predicted dehydrogenase